MEIEKCIICTKDNICKKCRKKIANQKYYKKNKEKMCEWMRKYNSENKELNKERQLDWRKRNRQRERDRSKVYFKENPEIVNRRVKSYIKRNPEKPGEMHDKRNYDGLRIKCLERDNFTCQDCGMTREEHVEKYECNPIVHHIDGVGRDTPSPNNTLENLQTLCKSCHGKKHGRNKKGRLP